MKTWTSVLLMACVAAVPVAALDKEQTAQARKVFEANKNAVVFLTGVTQMELAAAGQTVEREGNFQTIGTVIDPSGMVVAALSTIGASGEQTVGAQRVLIKVKRHDQVKIVLEDGTEVPADVVLKDPDLDLAFIMPRKESDEYKAATWTVAAMDASAEVRILDTVLIVARVGRSFNLESIAGLSEISGVVTKPRKFYLGPTRPGAPVFTLGGQAIGITVMYKAPGDDSSRAVVVLPAEDVLKIAEQAKSAKPAEEEEETSPAPTDEEE